jgi:hypothetical protein
VGPRTLPRPGHLLVLFRPKDGREVLGHGALLDARCAVEAEVRFVSHTLVCLREDGTGGALSLSLVLCLCGCMRAPVGVSMCVPGGVGRVRCGADRPPPPRCRSGGMRMAEALGWDAAGGWVAQRPHPRPRPIRRPTGPIHASPAPFPVTLGHSPPLLGLARMHIVTTHVLGDPGRVSVGLIRAHPD